MTSFQDAPDEAMKLTKQKKLVLHSTFVTLLAYESLRVLLAKCHPTLY